MKLFNFGNKENKNEVVLPYQIRTEFIPYHLYSNRKDSATLFIRVKNLQKEPALTSISFKVPKQLNIGKSGLEKQIDLKLGELRPDEEKEVKLEIFPTAITDAGDYTSMLYVMSHYRSYSYVITSMKKEIIIHVV
ncbi:MAG: hypothetical protein ACP5RP_01665 [Candidatus Micrarchaeia archaeon]